MTVLRTQLAGLARRPARLLLTGLALIVAATVVFGTVLAQRIMTQTILDTFSGTSAAADIVVGDGTGTSAAALDVVRRTPGVESATARNEAFYDVPAVAGTWLQVIGDPGSGPLSAVTLAEGAYPSAPGQIAVTPRTAERMGLVVGGTLRIRAGSEAPHRTLTVTGIVRPASGEGFAGSAYTTSELVDAMLVADGAASLSSRIEAHLAPGADPAAVAGELRRTLPRVPDQGGGQTVTAGGQQSSTMVTPDVVLGAELRDREARAAADSMGELFYLVGLFVAIAAAAAALVATATFRIVFAQRMRQLALMRAIGAGRGALTRALAAEGALTGLVAGVTGVLIAYLLGLAAGPAARVFLDARLASPGLPVVPALLVVLGTTLIALVAVLSPAATASRVSPLEALRSASVTGAQSALGRGRWAFGLVLTVLAVLLLGLAVAGLPEADVPDSGSPELSMTATVASGTVAFFSLIVLGPTILRPVLWLAGLPLRAFGPAGRLAVGGVGGAPKRAASVSVVVALAVTLTAAALIAVSTTRITMEQELALSAPADLQIAAPEGEPIPVGALRAAPELTGVLPFRVAEVASGASTFTVADLSLASLPTGDDIRVSAGSLADAGPGRAIASDWSAGLLEAGQGRQVTLSRNGRTVTVTVVATVGGLPMESMLLLDPADLTALGTPAEPTVVLADAAGDRSAAVRAAQAIVAGGGVTVLADARDDLAEQLLLITVVALGLVGMTVAVAVVGVGTTTALSVVERLREAGLLRAVGMSRGRLRATLLLEASLYGVVGALLGLALAVPFAWLLLAAAGLDAPLALPWGQLALVVLVLGLLTAVSGVLPARRASRVSPTAALAMD
ncbi:hypothetical protein JCM9534A_81520 [Catenuloplanes indicus JCM 9534]